MLSNMLGRASKSSGIFLGLVIIAASAPAMANAVDKSLDIDPSPVVDALPELQAVKPVDAEAQPSSNMLDPTDRKIQVLQGLNDRYKCGVVTSQQPISRAEFVNKVGACLTALEIKLAQEPGAIANEDIEQLKELADAFRDEVITLQSDMSVLDDRVQNVETKLAQNNSAFSTTTKLVGEVIFGLNTFGGAPAPNTGSTTFTNRVRLNFDTSFTGKDRLRTRIQARNTTPFSGATVTGTNTTRLGFDGSEENTSVISLLQYKTPFADKGTLILETNGSEYNENMYTFNPLLTSSGSGSISRFGRYNPVYRLSGDGAAATLEYKLSDQLTASVGYAVPLGSAPAPGQVAVGIANNPDVNNGLFNGSNSIISQLRYQAAPGIDLGAIYARSYHSGGSGVTGSTGTAFANNPFGGNRTSANHYSFLASAKVSPSVVLSGWVGFTNASNETLSGSQKADIFNFAVSAAFPDLGAKGNTLAFIVGQPPKVTSNTNAARVDTASPLHLEALYKVKFSDNIDITPGVLVITNPDTTTKNTEYVGTIRTTFKF